MSAMASHIAGVSSVRSTVCSGADQRKHQSSASLAIVRGIHRWPVDSFHKGSITWKMFPFDDVIASSTISVSAPQGNYCCVFNSSPYENRIAVISQTSFSNAFSMHEKFRISIQISLNFVLKGSINNKAVLVEVMTWRRTGYRPLSESMLTQLGDAYIRH